MTDFKVINNATTLVNDDLIFDPWIYGCVYYGTWRPYNDITFDKNKLKNVKYCCISHVHSDHWDLETIKYLNKDVIFYLPKISFNKVIELGLNKIGFHKIKYIEFNKFLEINDNYSIAAIPPLNRYAQETEFIDEKDDNAIAVDSGFILNIKSDDSNHLLLCDNTPYDKGIFKKNFKDIKIDSIFFPYNGFADDYPLCYDNFDHETKSKISYERSIKREEALLDFIKYIKPKHLIPYSSDFMLNGKRRNEFFKIHSIDFLDKEKYSNRIERLTNIKSSALFDNNVLSFNNNQFSVSTNKNLNNKPTTSDGPIKLFDVDLHKNITLLSQESLINYIERIKKYNFNINKINEWLLNIELTDTNEEVQFNFEEMKVYENFKKNKDKKVLILKTNRNTFQSILERKMHINNCIIGCLLSWERTPNIYSKDLHGSLSFLHL